jgi:hypothetical protein
MGIRISLVEQHNIFCLNSPTDDDLYKIYYIKSQYLTNKWYRVIATAFGSTSCSCEDQTKNPYQSCNHMKRLDIILKDTSNDIQTLSHIPKFILDVF